MAHFGKAGVRTPHVPAQAGAEINLSAGEALFCTLDVTGQVPTFEFGCGHNSAWATATGPVRDRYQWTTFDEVNSRSPQGDMHTLVLSFVAVTRYRFRMEVFDAGMALVKVVMDIEYETSEPTDVATEPIRLFAK